MGHVLLLSFPVSYGSVSTRVFSSGNATCDLGCFSAQVRCRDILYSLRACGALRMCAASYPNGISAQEDGMKTETFVRRSRINASAAEAHPWHALPGALERLTPPGEHVQVNEKTGGIERGARVVL